MNKKIKFLFTVLIFFSFTSVAQHIFPVAIKDSVTKEPIPGATILLEESTNGASTNENGIAQLRDIPNGMQLFRIAFIGYKSKIVKVNFPVSFMQPYQVFLEPEDSQLEEVVVTSTRTNSRIEDSPIKAEVLGQEELTEETSIKPGNVGSILGDISSIQVQQTSAVTNTSVVRMQGLDGKYTLLLRDGLPSFGGLSGGLSILQIPPLDLKQIEIVKGPASTLNGGGAIAGLINFISKEPGDSSEKIFSVNQSTLSESNINAYLSGQKNKSGYTFLAAYTMQQETDVNNDGYSDVPLLHSFLVHPRFFYAVNSHSKIKIGLTVSSENRTGGDMQAIKMNSDSTHSFFIKTKSNRSVVDVDYKNSAGNKNILSVKASLSYFNREEISNLNLFHGNQWNGYSEVYYSIPRNKHHILFGGNILTDNFNKLSTDSFAINKYANQTIGFFTQYSYDDPGKINFQVGLRSDYHSVYRWYVLPSAAILFHTGNNFSIRINGGTGYKVPDLLEFTENSFYNTSFPEFSDEIRAENSYGGTAEWNFKKIIGDESSIYFNQTFFSTTIENNITSADTLTNFFFNSNGKVTTKGIDNYFRFQTGEFELYAGYTYTLPRTEAQTKHYLSYTPLHRAALTIVNETTDKLRLGFETSYNGFQYRDDGSKTSDYFFLAATVQYKTGKWKFVLNGENLLDYRQTKKENIVSGDRFNPQFKKLWAPIDGRVINLSVMVRL